MRKRKESGRRRQGVGPKRLRKAEEERSCRNERRRAEERRSLASTSRGSLQTSRGTEPERNLSYSRLALAVAKSSSGDSSRPKNPA